jgi:hypothetical protein
MLRPLRATCLKIVWRPHNDWAGIVGKSVFCCFFSPFIPKAFVLKRNNYLFWRDRASVIFSYVVRRIRHFCDISLKTGNSANKTYLLKVTLINVALRRKKYIWSVKMFWSVRESCESDCFTGSNFTSVTAGKINAVLRSSIICKRKDGRRRRIRRIRFH